jgi:hypothetical protein
MIHSKTSGEKGRRAVKGSNFKRTCLGFVALALLRRKNFRRGHSQWLGILTIVRFFNCRVGVISYRPQSGIEIGIDLFIGAE